MRKEREGEDKSDETYGQTPPADIQAILTVLGRRTYDYDEQPLNLGQTDLHGMNLIRANLNGANLTNANLEAVPPRRSVTSYVHR